MTPLNTVLESQRFAASTEVFPQPPIQVHKQKEIIVHKAKKSRRVRVSSEPMSSTPTLTKKTMTTTATTYQRKDILEAFRTDFPVFDRAYSIYDSLEHLGTSPEDTLRKSSEITLLEVIELIVIASRQSKEAKRASLRQALVKLDTLKVFADLARHMQGADEALTAKIGEQLQNLGKMIGGWARNLAKQKEE